MVARLEAAKLGRHVGPLTAVMGPCLEIETEVTGDERLAIGESKLGGWPDLGEGTAWPAIDGRPLPFIAQLRLDEVAEILPGCELPQTGLLSIFFDGDFAGYPDDRRPDRCRVLFDHGSALRRMPPTPPMADEFVFRACAAYFTPHVTLPPVEEIYVEGELPVIPAVHPILERSADRSRYQRVRRRLRTLAHRLLGHPDDLQGGELKLALVRDLDREDRYRYEDYEWTNLEAMVAEMRQWRLLFQIATDPAPQMSWGDGGLVHVWIRDEDLRAHRFDRVYARMVW